MSYKKKVRWFTYAILLMCAVGYLALSYVYKPHDKIENIGVDFSGSSEEFKSLFLKEQEKWSGKVVQISGVPSDVSDDHCMIDGSLFCQFKQPVEITKGHSITVKGRIAGYDELLEEIKIDECILINQSK